jgi:integrase
MDLVSVDHDLLEYFSYKVLTFVERHAVESLANGPGELGEAKAKGHAELDPHVVTHRHGTALYHAMRKVYEATKIPYPSGRPLHVLRHSCCSILLAKGVPVHDVRDILGHASLRTTDIYATSRLEDRREAIRKIGAG